MKVKDSEAAVIGLVLGIVWLIIGFSYNNTAVMMLGGIMLGLGLYYKLKKESVKNSSQKVQNNKTELF